MDSMEYKARKAKKQLVKMIRSASKPTEVNIHFNKYAKGKGNGFDEVRGSITRRLDKMKVTLPKLPWNE